MWLHSPNPPKWLDSPPNEVVPKQPVWWAPSIGEAVGEFKNLWGGGFKCSYHQAIIQQQHVDVAMFGNAEINNSKACGLVKGTRTANIDSFRIQFAHWRSNSIYTRNWWKLATWEQIETCDHFPETNTKSFQNQIAASIRSDLPTIIPQQFHWLCWDWVYTFDFLRLLLMFCLSLSLPGLEQTIQKWMPAGQYYPSYIHERTNGGLTVQQHSIPRNGDGFESTTQVRDVESLPWCYTPTTPDNIEDEFSKGLHRTQLNTNKLPKTHRLCHGRLVEFGNSSQ